MSLIASGAFTGHSSHVPSSNNDMIQYDMKSALLKSRQAVSFIYCAEPKNGKK